jgi:hypothetical protein
MSVLSLAIGSYLLLTLPDPWIAMTLLGLGLLAVVLTGRIASLRQIRTRYEPEAWTARDALICAAAVVVALGSVIGSF